MGNTETRIHKLSFYGRLVDNLTREVIPYKKFKVFIEGSKSKPFYKEDGYFIFSDLQPTASDYEFNLTGKFYQPRTIKKGLSTSSPVELTYRGEDELYVFIKDIKDGTEKKVTFDKIRFAKTIPEGSEVIGEGGFSSSLKRTLEGEDVEFAILDSVAGLNPGEILRFIRSHNIIMRLGPYNPFEPQITLLSLKFVKDDLAETPVADVKIEIEEINDTPINTVNVGSLAVKTVTLTGPPVTNLILGSNNDITTHSNLRGDCIFYYPSDTPITKLKLKIARTGYVSTSEVIGLTNKQRTSKIIKLTKA